MERRVKEILLERFWSRTGRAFVLFLILTGLLSACQDDMSDQPKFEPLEPSIFFDDLQSARPIIPNTVPFGSFEQGTSYYDGRTGDGDYLTEIPVELTQELLERGAQRYEIFCSPCHGLSGYGQGMIVQRGFPPPPSFHETRLRHAPVGYFFDVISNGYGEMYAFDYRISTSDRWAVIAYIRALQLSQHISRSALTAEEQQLLEEEE